MIIPKFKIGDNVFIYEKGKLVERVIGKIKIIIEEEKAKASYQFKTKDAFERSLFHDYYLDEQEVFSSRIYAVEQRNKGNCMKIKGWFFLYACCSIILISCLTSVLIQQKAITNLVANTLDSCDAESQKWFDKYMQDERRLFNLSH